MSHVLLAHAGKTHATEAEEATHSLQTVGATVPADALMASAALATLAIAWLLMTLVLKWRLSVRLLVVMVSLLVVGVIGYQNAPITSVVALASGFALALTNVLLQLMPDKRQEAHPASPPPAKHR